MSGDSGLSQWWLAAAIRFEAFPLRSPAMASDSQYSLGVILPL